MRLENMRHSVAEIFSVMVVFSVLFQCWNVPRTPVWARPNML